MGQLNCLQEKCKLTGVKLLSAISWTIIRTHVRRIMKRNALTKSTVSVKWGRTKHDQRTNHSWQLANQTCCVNCKVFFDTVFHYAIAAGMDINAWHTTMVSAKKNKDGHPKLAELAHIAAHMGLVGKRKPFCVSSSKAMATHSISQNVHCDSDHSQLRNKPFTRPSNIIKRQLRLFGPLPTRDGEMLCIAPLIWVLKRLCGP